MEAGSQAIDLEALDDAALRALQARDVATARRLLTQAADADSGNVDRWLKLAAACRASGDPNAALDALERGLVIAPRHYMALLMRASIMDRQGHPKAAEAYGVALTQAPKDELLDPPTLAATRRARQVHEQYTADLRTFLTQTVAPVADKCSPMEQRKVVKFLDDALHLRKRYRQEPAQFYWPGLPDIEFYDRELFPWLEAFEAATPAIIEELMGVIDKSFTGFIPYIDYADHLPLDQWAELNRNPDWSAFHLIRGGKVVPGNADRCPRTIEAISKLPCPEIGGRGPVALFSTLQPHTRIPPHTGVSNTRLLVHLPLIMPGHCGFRVGNETREWKVGEAWVFDDTLEHEAWNDSDEIRIILIVDIWNPFLSDTEKAAIKSAMEAMDRFGGSSAGVDG